MRIFTAKGFRSSAATFLLILQLGAFFFQFEKGFRFFAKAPDRVPFSWDMFAVEITRCQIEWSGAGSGNIRWGDQFPFLEWETNFASVEDYAGVADRFCHTRLGSFEKYHLRCMLPDGRMEDRQTLCKNP